MFKQSVENLGMHPSTERLFQALKEVAGIDAHKEPGRAAAHLGERNVAVLTNWKSRGISKAGMVNAARKLGISSTWLLDGTGPMRTGGVSMPSAVGEGSQRSAIDLEDNPDYPAIRRVRFKLSAGASGYAIEYLDADEGAPIVFQRTWYESRGFRPEKLFAIKVANGSMEPGLCHGDTVVVNTESAHPKDGVVFAVNYEGEMVVKRLARDAGEWWLSSDNSDQRRYPRKVCHADTFILGEVVHKQSERI